MKRKILFSITFLIAVNLVMLFSSYSLAAFVTTTEVGGSPQTEDSSGPVEIWKSDIYSSSVCYPSVADSLVYFTCEDGYVYALDRGSGNKRWQYHLSGEIFCPSVDQGQYLIVGTATRKIYALDAATGSELWQKKMDRRIVHSPLVDSKRIYAGTGGSSISGLDLQSGANLWRRKLGKIKANKKRDSGRSPEVESVVLTPVDLGEWIIITSFAMRKAGWSTHYPVISLRKRFAYYVNKASGKVKWKWSSEAKNLSSEVSNSLVQPGWDGDNIYVYKADGTIAVLNVESGEEKNNPVLGNLEDSTGFVLEGGSLFIWSERGNVLRVETGSWEKKWGAVVWPKIVGRPLVYANGFYIFTEDGTLHCLDPGSGKSKWKYSLVGVPGSSPVLHKGVIYTWLNDGRFHALRVGEDLSTSGDR